MGAIKLKESAKKVQVSTKNKGFRKGLLPLALTSQEDPLQEVGFMLAFVSYQQAQFPSLDKDPIFTKNAAASMARFPLCMVSPWSSGRECPLLRKPEY